ncbi:hypothetical protein CDAR_424451 [Caerostris darwini]|uniref:Uncharacterized protein n=1 Tax=Caerostris darwini TaxID=1538125 RepID=A0AAV4T255_9ARAC|nr:hypothetical protein CDAR_424451 [Caerostris darwini]
METLCLLLIWKYNPSQKRYSPEQNPRSGTEYHNKPQKVSAGRSIELFSSFLHGKSAITEATGRNKEKLLQKGRKIPNISTQKSALPHLTGRLGEKEKKQAADFLTFSPTLSASARRKKRSERGEIVSDESFSVAGGRDFAPLCKSFRTFVLPGQIS